MAVSVTTFFRLSTVLNSLVHLFCGIFIGILGLWAVLENRLIVSTLQHGINAMLHDGNLNIPRIYQICQGVIGIGVLIVLIAILGLILTQCSSRRVLFSISLLQMLCAIILIGLIGFYLAHYDEEIVNESSESFKRQFDCANNATYPKRWMLSNQGALTSILHSMVSGLVLRRWVIERDGARVRDGGSKVTHTSLNDLLNLIH